jgi:hypothetical protein
MLDGSCGLAPERAENHRSNEEQLTLSTKAVNHAWRLQPIISQKFSADLFPALRSIAVFERTVT